MRCRDCPRYDPDVERCRDGKVNPLRWEQAVEAANVLGLRAICPLSDFRERLILSRTPAPPRRSARRPMPPRPASRPPAEGVE